MSPFAICVCLLFGAKLFIKKEGCLMFWQSVLLLCQEVNEW